MPVPAEPVEEEAVDADAGFRQRLGHRLDKLLVGLFAPGADTQPPAHRGAKPPPVMLRIAVEHRQHHLHRRDVREAVRKLPQVTLQRLRLAVEGVYTRLVEIGSGSRTFTSADETP